MSLKPSLDISTAFHEGPFCWGNVFWTRKVKICIELILVFYKSTSCVVFHTSLVHVCSLERVVLLTLSSGEKKHVLIYYWLETCCQDQSSLYSEGFK